ncbi:hypothetical protein QFZ99_002578 [Paraburkholderia atlantica]
MKQKKSLSSGSVTIRSRPVHLQSMMRCNSGPALWRKHQINVVKILTSRAARFSVRGSNVNVPDVKIQLRGLHE